MRACTRKTAQGSCRPTNLYFKVAIWITVLLSQFHSLVNFETETHALVQCANRKRFFWKNR